MSAAWNYFRAVTHRHTLILNCEDSVTKCNLILINRRGDKRLQSRYTVKNTETRKYPAIDALRILGTKLGVLMKYDVYTRYIRLWTT